MTTVISVPVKDQLKIRTIEQTNEALNIPLSNYLINLLTQ